MVFLWGWVASSTSLFAHKLSAESPKGTGLWSVTSAFSEFCHSDLTGVSHLESTKPAWNSTFVYQLSASMLKASHFFQFLSLGAKERRLKLKCQWRVNALIFINALRTGICKRSISMGVKAVLVCKNRVKKPNQLFCLSSSSKQGVEGERVAGALPKAVSKVGLAQNSCWIFGWFSCSTPMFPSEPAAAFPGFTLVIQPHKPQQNFWTTEIIQCSH